eukprot:TRINITY_DN59075_c0_g1_i1.p1 TRINITY_DN59075_c0_g1~~TRINITY_DN59075_c0_g1_i1.p1  ORF type:complete len:134 (-),score=12.51 TRINITY_DN59075_c0_g1_i1:89-490(-)
MRAMSICSALVVAAALATSFRLKVGGKSTRARTYTHTHTRANSDKFCDSMCFEIEGSSDKISVERGDHKVLGAISWCDVDVFYVAQDGTRSSKEFDVTACKDLNDILKKDFAKCAEAYNQDHAALKGVDGACP